TIEGRADAAERHYREALRHDPSFAKAWNNLGVLLAARGRLAEAKDCFLRVLELTPHHAEAAGNLAALLRQEQGVREAPGSGRGSGPGPDGNRSGSQKALERKGN
ncbi:MAG: tetratricopeptide repeat protein, partial [Thermodesulfobacteriota bacterium]